MISLHRPRLGRGSRVVLVLLALLATPPPLRADEVLFLRDGRKILVTRLARRAGYVLFQTTRGDVFSVPENQVVSPPLSRIPLDEGQVLALRDGRRIFVFALKRRGGRVAFETTRGEVFSVPEDQVLSPPLDSIERVDVPRAAPAPAPAPAPTPAPAPSPAPSPAEPPRLPQPPSLSTVGSPWPDRWSVAFPDDPRLAKGHWTNPYNRNVLKGDEPVLGDSVYLALAASLDLPLDVRGSPVGPGVVVPSTTSLDFLGGPPRFVAGLRAGLTAELFEGASAFRPKGWAIRAGGAFGFRRVRVGGSDLAAGGRAETHADVGLQEAFAEARLLTVSRRFDFLSVRGGLQPFVSDFRGFVLNDLPAGARLFGTAAANRVQMNAAWFELLRKRPETRLNMLQRADREVLVGNVYVQDLLPGYRLAASYHHLREHPVDPSPADAEIHYLGLSGDGRLGGLGLTHAVYRAWGESRVEDRPADVDAWMAALEVWLPREWVRYRASLFFATGDDDPADGRAQGFDAIQDLPHFAGGSVGFWHRSGIALPRAGVLLKPPDSLLPSLRSGKFSRSSFVNPGLLLAGLGVEMDLTPKLQARLLAHHLRFHRTRSLEQLIGGTPVRPAIGVELGMGLRYRPFLNEHVAMSGGLSGLVPGPGWKDLDPALCARPACARSAHLWNGFLRVELAY